MNFLKKNILFILILVSSFQIYSQEYGNIKGNMQDEQGRPISLVNVAIMGYPIGAITNKEGKYELKTDLFDLLALNKQ